MRKIFGVVLVFIILVNILNAHCEAAAAKAPQAPVLKAEAAVLVEQKTGSTV